MSAKKRVLCVDDQEDTCALVSAILEEYDVVAEHNKAGGVRQAAMEKFDLILVDYHLPDGTGLELCVLIRAFDPNTPILLVTCTHTITHEQVIAVGGQGVIRKDRLSHLLPVAVASAFEVKFLKEYGVQPLGNLFDHGNDLLPLTTDALRVLGAFAKLRLRN